MIVVFPFDGVAFHGAGCGSAFLSATESVRTQAAKLTSVAYSFSSAQCLLYSAVIGVGAKLQSFLRSSDERSLRASSSSEVASCVRLLVWLYIL